MKHELWQRVLYVTVVFLSKYRPPFWARFR